MHQQLQLFVETREKLIVCILSDLGFEICLHIPRKTKKNFGFKLISDFARQFVVISLFWKK